MANPAYIVTKSSGTVSLYLSGKAYSVGKEHPNYEAILKALAEGKPDNLPNLLDVSKSIAGRFTDGNVVVKDGQVLYGNVVVNNVVVDRILEFMRQQYDFKPLVKFLKNLMDNPSKASLDNLYRFLEHNNMPITEDGCFLAYKAVRADYKDCHSGTFDNSPGKTVSMPRNMVQDDPNITCSHGLHVAALSYVSNQYSGKTVVVVKVNPRDVVSVPTDYDNQKMRVCEYVVLEDFKGEAIKQESVVGREAAPVTLDDDTDYEDRATYASASYDDDDGWDDDEDELDDDWDDDDDDLDDEDEEEDEPYSDRGW